MLARFGGDEFAALISEIGRAERLLAVVSELERAVAGEPIVIDGHECAIEVTLGTAALNGATFPTTSSGSRTSGCTWLSAGPAPTCSTVSPS